MGRVRPMIINRPHPGTLITIMPAGNCIEEFLKDVAQLSYDVFRKESIERYKFDPGSIYPEDYIDYDHGKPIQLNLGVICGYDLKTIIKKGPHGAWYFKADYFESRFSQGTADQFIHYVHTKFLDKLGHDSAVNL